MEIATSIPGFRIRKASIEDCSSILGFIAELAEYEKLSHELAAVSYALYFHNFSTFTGRPGIYLEDIYVKPAMRGKGFGKSLLSYLAKLAVDNKFTRVEWSVLDWNEPSIQFYRSIGAEPMEGWTVQRLDGDALSNFAEKFS